MTSKVYIKKFSGKHFSLHYSQSNVVEIYFPKIDNDRLIFTIQFQVVPSEKQLEDFIKDQYSNLKTIFVNLKREVNRVGIETTLSQLKDIHDET